MHFPLRRTLLLALLLLAGCATLAETSVTLYTTRARAQAAGFDYTGAIASMDAALLVAQTNGFPARQRAELFALRGQIIILTYEWDRALADYNTAIALDPTYADAYFLRGVLYYSLAERERALADFQQYLALAADGPYAAQAAQYISSIETELQALGDE